MFTLIPMLKTLFKPLVIAFLNAELPVIAAKMKEKGYSDSTIKLVTDIINEIILVKGGA